VSVKKAKGETEETAKKSTKKAAKKSANKKRAEGEGSGGHGDASGKINNLVGKSARVIANKVIEAARDGQLASARYLFEAVGLYPATEQTAAPPVKDTLAHTPLTRLGMPLDPVVCDEDEDFITEGLQGDAEDQGTGTSVPSVAQEDEKGECEEQTRITLVKNEREGSNEV
jgi:hypothetical protein